MDPADETDSRRPRLRRSLTVVGIAAASAVSMAGLIAIPLGGSLANCTWPIMGEIVGPNAAASSFTVNDLVLSLVGWCIATAPWLLVGFLSSGRRRALAYTLAAMTTLAVLVIAVPHAVDPLGYWERTCSTR